MSEIDKPIFPKKLIEPGSFGCHEALHMTHVLMEMVDYQVAQHPSVTQHAEWEALADSAVQALSDLYSAMREQHEPERVW